MARNAANASDPIEAYADVGAVNWFVPERTYSEERVRWAQAWRELPVYARKKDLSALIRSFTSNEVTILVAGTGSGKTVLAPPLMLWALGESSRIVVTMPKQAVVRAAAATAAKTLDAAMGQDVGFKYRGSPSASMGHGVRALYATDGTLLAMARHDARLMRFDAVIMDEAHERPVPTDLLMHAVRNAIIARRGTDRPLRLVVMSATIDPAPFIGYFAKPGLSVGLVEFPAKPNHPVQRTFLKAPSQNPVTDAIDAAVRILNDPASTGKVIVFVPTTRDAVGGCPAFSVSCSKGSSSSSSCATAACSPLYGRQNKDEQLTALLNDSASASASRKVYVATNIAESSLTINGVDHVVDTGLQVSSVWRPLWHGTELMIHIASRAQLDQRMGRTGRTAPGQAHLMYTQAQYDALSPFPEPVILQVDITEPLLTLLRSGDRASSDVQAAPDQASALKEAVAVLSDLLTPPTNDQIASAVAYLAFYGLVDVPNGILWHSTSVASYEGSLTPLGKRVASIVSELKVSIDNAVLIAFAAQEKADVLLEALDLVAILEVSKGGVDPMWRSKEGKSSPRPDGAIRRFVSKQPVRSDHVALVHVLQKIARSPQHPLNRFLAPKVWRTIVERSNELRAPRNVERLLDPKDGQESQSLHDVVVRARAFHRCQQRLKDSRGLLPAPIAALNPPKVAKQPVARSLVPWFIDAPPPSSQLLDLVYETYAKAITSPGRAFIITVIAAEEAVGKQKQKQKKR